jgi:rod shape-determining protein MreC
MVTPYTSKRLQLFTNNEFSLASFSILIFVCFVLIGFDARHQILLKIKKDFFIFSSPIIKIINFPQSLIKEKLYLIDSKNKLFKDNKELKKELYEKSIENQKLKLLESENLNLRNQLRLKKLSTIKSEPAEIIMPSIKGNQNIITIDKGKNDGIKAGSALINSLGLVGQIYAVYIDSSEVLPLLSEKFAVPAILENGKHNVIIYGDNENLVIPFSSIHNNINIDQVFVTSGLDQIYPKGIKIGKVINIIESSNNQFNKIIIQPFSYPKTYSQVTIVNLVK